MPRRIVSYYRYTTMEGDSFDSLAYRLYRSERKAGEIARFNPDYCDVLLFDAGVSLKLPVFASDDAPETLAPWRRE